MNKKFDLRALAAIIFSLAFLLINAAWMPQPAAAQEAAPVTVEIVVPAMTADTTDETPPPSNWSDCNSWAEPGYDSTGCRQAAHDWQDARPNRPEPPAIDADDAAWATWAAIAIPGGMSETTTCGLAPSTCRPPACTMTAEPIYGEWSEWVFDLQTGNEYRTRTVTVVDAYDSSIVCDSYVEIETRPGASCTMTAEPIYGEWSEWEYNPATGQEERYRTVTILDEYDSSVICEQVIEVEGRPVAPSCTKDGFAAVYVTVTFDGNPIERQQIALDILDGSGNVTYTYVAHSDHAGKTWFNVGLEHWSKNSVLRHASDDRPDDAMVWEFSTDWTSDDADGNTGFLWGLTDCIAAYGNIALSNPTPVNAPVAAMPVAPCEEQGG